MLAPRFTLRAGLIGLTAGALVAVAVREAVQGEPWAVGVSVALLAVVLSLLLQAAVFGLSLALSTGQSGAARSVGAKKARVRLAGVESSSGGGPDAPGPETPALGARRPEGEGSGANPSGNAVPQRQGAGVDLSSDNHVEGGKG